MEWPIRSDRCLITHHQTWSWITLYRDKEVIRPNIPTAEAVDALIDLIKAHGMRVEATQDR